MRRTLVAELRRPPWNPQPVPPLSPSPSPPPPRFSRRLNSKGGVEFLRRHGLAGDPEFMELYRDAKRGNLRQPVFLLIGLALVGVILFGVRYLGWTW